MTVAFFSNRGANHRQVGGFIKVFSQGVVFAYTCATKSIHSIDGWLPEQLNIDRSGVSFHAPHKHQQCIEMRYKIINCSTTIICIGFSSNTFIAINVHGVFNCVLPLRPAAASFVINIQGHVRHTANN